MEGPPSWQGLAEMCSCLSGSGPGLFQHILLGALVVAFFLFLFQFCMHV